MDNIKSKLEEIYDVKKEIIEVSEKIKKLEDGASVEDLVMGSMASFPYSKVNINIKADNRNKVVEVRKYLDILKERLERLLTIQVEVEEFISSLPTSRLRRIFTFKYLDQCTWQRIALMIGGKATADSVRMEHDRFLKEK